MIHTHLPELESVSITADEMNKGLQESPGHRIAQEVLVVFETLLEVGSHFDR